MTASDWRFAALALALVVLCTVSGFVGACMNEGVGWNAERVQSQDEDHWCWTITLDGGILGTPVSKVACEVDMDAEAAG